MSNVSALAAAQTNPLIQRPMGTRQPPMDDRVYDPVLDPALNPALRADGVTNPNGLEEITVTGQKPTDDGGLSFWDFLDLINPLQHIPIVNTLYRDLTGDTIKTPIQLIGSTIVGGPIGFATAMVDSIIEEATGTDIGGHAMAMLKGERPQPTNVPMENVETQLAAAQEFVPENYKTAAAPAALTNIPAVALASSPTRSAVAAALPREAPVRDMAAVKRANAQYAQQMAMAAPQPTPVPAQNQTADGKTPTEAEAFVQAAQIAAQANVFPTFKRNGSTGGATSGVQAQQEAAAKAATTQAALTQAQNGGRFMPINRGGVMAAPVRGEGSATDPSELKARARFSPGPLNPGGSSLAPATVAAAVAARKQPAAPEPVTVTRPVSSQEAYTYGRAAANSETPADVPPWFDSAMMNAIDKYKAMQQAQ